MRPVEPTIRPADAQSTATASKKMSAVERAAPPEVNTLLWRLSDKTERREILSTTATKLPSGADGARSQEVPEAGSTLRKLAKQGPAIKVSGLAGAATLDRPVGASGTATLGAPVEVHAAGGWADGALGWVGDRVDGAVDRVTDVADAGKEKARELIEDGRDAVADRVRSAEEKLRDLASTGRDRVDAAWDDAKSRVDKLVDDGRDFVIDQARSAEEEIRDRASAGRDRVSDAWNRGRERVSDAIDDGKDKVRDAWNVVNDVVDRREAVGDALLEKTTGVSSSVEALRPGDSLTIGASAEGGALLVLQGGSGVEVLREQDGSYTVSGGFEARGGVGVGDLGAATLGGGARGEYRFDNLADAQQGAQALLKASSPALSMAGLSSDEAALLRDHLSAVEVKLTGQAQADLRAGVSGLPSEFSQFAPVLNLQSPALAEWLGGGGALQGDTTLRVEFDDRGAPAAVVERLDVEAALDGSFESSKLQELVGVAGLTLPDAAEGRYVTTVERRQTVNADLSLGEPLYSASGRLEAELDGQGWQATVRTPQVSEADFGQSVRDGWLTGGPVGAFLDIAADSTFTHNTFTDESRGWLDNSVGIVVASAKGDNVIRRNDPEKVVDIGSVLD